MDGVGLRKLARAATTALGATLLTMGGASGVMLNGTSCDDYKNKVVKDVVVQLPCVIP